MKVIIMPICFVLFVGLISCNRSTTSDHISTENDTINNSIIEPNPIITDPIVTNPTELTQGQISGNIGGCSYNDTNAENLLILYNPRTREINQINNILKYSGLTSNFNVYAAKIGNAIAANIGNERYILYDPDLLSYTDQQSNSFWSSMSILAHEIGHHLSGHTISVKGSTPSMELEADKFSGFVLYKMGATLPQAQAAMLTLASDFETLTHPAKDKRLVAIQRGWNEANNQRYDYAIPPPPLDIINPDGGSDEFGPGNLLSTDAYNSMTTQNESGVLYLTALEGIIIERSINLDGEYLVLITKNNSGVFDGNLSVGQKANINILEVWNAHQMAGRSGLSWLDAIMVPGRRIGFNIGLEGNAPFLYFTRIKSLPAE